MDWYDGYQVWLTEAQQLHNAQNIATYYSKKGRDKKAICALIGNMMHESSVNPNMYEYGYSWGADRGYGLVQWTPRSKLSNWADSQGKNFKTGETQLDRIDYEIDNGIQWISTSRYPISFDEFRKNSKGYSLDDLTASFMYNYERPANPGGSIGARQKGANLAYNKLSFSKSATDNPIKKPSKSEEEEKKVNESYNTLDKESISRFFNEIINNIKDSIEDALTIDLYRLDKENYFSNKFLNIYKVNDIMYKVKPSKNIFKIFTDGINSANSLIATQNNNTTSPVKPPKVNTEISTNSNENINKVVKKAMSYTLDSVPYSMYGARDMVSSGDCSAFVRICFQAAGIDIGTYTGAQYEWAKRNGKIIVDGWSDSVEKICNSRKQGDYILMCKAAAGNFGGGGASHVVLVVNNTDIRHQTSYPNGRGPKQTNCNQYIRDLRDYNGYVRWCLVRPFK